MSSTTLATGQTVTLTGDTGAYFVVSTSGGIASMTVTPVNGRPETENIGPLPYRRTWGPYKDGATAVIVNQTAPALAYEQLSTAGGGAQSPVSGGGAARAAIEVTGPLLLSAAHDGAIMHITSNPVLTINTGLAATFSADMRGAFTTAGTATIADERTAGAIYPYASLIPEPTANSFVLVGSKL